MAGVPDCRLDPGQCSHGYRVGCNSECCKGVRMLGLASVHTALSCCHQRQCDLDFDTDHCIPLSSCKQVSENYPGLSGIRQELKCEAQDVNAAYLMSHGKSRKQ